VSIPIELLTMAGGAISGALFKGYGMYMQNKKLDNELLLARLQGEHEVRKDVMEGPKRGWKGFQWTRRVIAISVVFSVIVLPKLAAFLSDAPQVVYGNVVEGTSFLWFTSATSINWTVMNGIPITPVDIHSCMAIIGLYFGASIVEGKSG